MVQQFGEKVLAKPGEMGQRKDIWIAAAGVAVILALTAALSSLLLRDMTERLLSHEGQVKQEFLNALLSAEAGGADLFATPSPSPALSAFSARVNNLPDLVRANIYSPDGFIRFSTDSNLVGLHFGENEELAEAFKGQVASSLEDAASVDKSEHLALNLAAGDKLIEAYIPVKGGNDTVTAVVEFYQRDRWVQDALAAARFRIWLAGVASAFVLVAAVLAARRFA